MMLKRADPSYLLKKMVTSAVGVRISGMEESVRKLEKISNRLILTILVGCLLVASSLVVLSGTPPFLWGMPMLGVVGYIILRMIRK